MATPESDFSHLIVFHDSAEVLVRSTQATLLSPTLDRDRLWAYPAITLLMQHPQRRGTRTQVQAWLAPLARPRSGCPTVLTTPRFARLCELACPGTNAAN